MHQFWIVRTAGGKYGIEFRRLGGVLARASGFDTKADARTAIAAIKLHAAGAAIVDLSQDEVARGVRYEIVPEGVQGYVVRFCTADGRPLATSDNYTVKRSAEACIAAMRDAGPFAEIVDATGEFQRIPVPA